MNDGNERTGINEYSDALDLIFGNNLTDGVAIRFESDGYALCVEIRDGKAEIIIYKL